MPLLPAESVGKDEVELLPFEVSLSHLDADRVAKVIYMMAATTAEAVVLLVEVIVIIVEILHANHAFTVVFIYLAVDTIAGYA